jgi:hypothetical protein
MSHPHRVLLLAILLAGCAFTSITSRAQGGFTTVTGTITDPSGLPYDCGTISAQLIVPGGTAPTLNGVGFTGSMSPVGLGCSNQGGSGASGSFSFRVADNGVILPSGTTWQFTVNISPGVPPPQGFGSRSFTVTTVINCGTNTPATCTSNSISLTTLLNSSAVALSRSSGICGLTGQIQVNNGGVCGASSNLMYSSATGSFSAVGSTSAVSGITAGLNDFAVSGSLGTNLVQLFANEVGAGVSIFARIGTVITASVPTTLTLGGSGNGTGALALAGNSGGTCTLGANATATLATFGCPVNAAAYLTATNCQLGGATGTASPAACGSAAAGKVAIPASQTTYTFSDTAVTAASIVIVQQVTDCAGLPSAPTCSATTTSPVESSRVAGTSFTVTLTSVAAVTGIQYWIVN